MVLLSCHCRNVVISVIELPKAFTPTEFANRRNLLPKVEAGDEAFSFLGSNETIAPVKLALGGVKVVYPDLQLKRDIGQSVLYKCAICSTYTHATDPLQQEDRSIVIHLGLEVRLIPPSLFVAQCFNLFPHFRQRDPMKLRQSDSYSPVFEVIVDEQKFPDSGSKVLNANLAANPNAQRGELVRNVIAEIQHRSFESCQKKQREKEEKIREFQQQCNREYEEFQRKVNRDRDALLRRVLTLSINHLPDSKQQANERTQTENQTLRPVPANDNDNSVFESPNLRFPANHQSDGVRLSGGGTVLNTADLEDMDMVYGNEEVHAGPAFAASDDSNSSNESIGRTRRRGRVQADIAQSAPMKVPAFQRRKSSDDDDDVEDDGRPFDFRRMTLEAASLSRFTNKSVVSDGTELFGPFPESGSNPPL